MAGSESLVEQSVCTHWPQTHPLKSEKLWSWRGLVSPSQPFLAGTAGSAEASPPSGSVACLIGENQEINCKQTWEPIFWTCGGGGGV